MIFLQTSNLSQCFSVQPSTFNPSEDVRRSHQVLIVIDGGSVYNIGRLMLPTRPGGAKVNASTLARSQIGKQTGKSSFTCDVTVIV